MISVKTATVAASVLLLMGCQGMGYAINNYGSTPRLNWKDSAGKEFGIYDKPSENRMMVTSSFGKAVAIGATYGLASDTGLVYRSAAEEYLRGQGRNCIATSTTLIVEPQYEVAYTCE